MVEVERAAQRPLRRGVRVDPRLAARVAVDVGGVNTPPAVERRREARFPTGIEVRLTDAVHAARVLRLLTRLLPRRTLPADARRLRGGRRLALSLVVGAERLPVDGVVAWVRPADKAIGVRFVDVADELRARLLGLKNAVASRPS